MRTILQPNYKKILGLFYRNKNSPTHLREISREIELKEGALSRHLNKLEEEQILVSRQEGNLKKFSIKQSRKAEILTILDIERYQLLPHIRKNALSFYLKALHEKPVVVVLFGSTAKGTFKETSDIDVVAIFNRKTDTEYAKRYAQAQTGIQINEFQLTYKQFLKELKLKEDAVIQSGFETGFPIYNHMHYYEVVESE